MKRLILLTGILASTLVAHPMLAQTAFRHTYDTPSGDQALALAQTDDGGYVFTGFTAYETAGGIDSWTVKTDAQGEVEWMTTFGRTKDDKGLDVTQTTDGGYVVVGWSQYEDVSYVDETQYIVKLTASGRVTWSRSIIQNESHHFNSVVATPGGGFVAVGDRTMEVAKTGAMTTQRQVLLEARDADGDAVWTRAYRDTDDDIQYGNDVIHTADGGYALIGVWGGTWSVNDRMFLLKTDADGNEQWRHSYFDAGTAGNAVIQTSDGGYLLAGYNGSYPMALKTDSQGEMEWYFVHDTEYQYGASFMSAAEMADGSYLLSGVFNGSDLVKVDAAGQFIQMYNIGAPNWYPSHTEQVIRTTDGGYAVLCQFSYHDGASVGLLKTDANMVVTGVEAGGSEQPGAFHLAQNYPNPFNPTTVIPFDVAGTAPVHLAVYDVLGREVAVLVDAVRTAGHYEVRWDAAGVPTGQYFYRLRSGSKVEARAMVLAR